MKKGSTLFLKGVIILLALAVLAACIFVLPKGIMSDHVGYYRPILIGMYIPAIPFFVAVFESLTLLNLIDHNATFSTAAVASLKTIKYCAGIIAGLYLIGLPYIYYAATRDDAPGVMLIGLVFTCAPALIAVAAAILQRLLQNAITLKSENDLTV
jgi:hypothetical protein